MPLVLAAFQNSEPFGLWKGIGAQTQPPVPVAGAGAAPRHPSL